MRIKVWGILITLMVVFQADAVMGWEKVNEDRKREERDPLSAKDQRKQMAWVDSVFHAQTFEERLGQLFMVAAYSNKDARHRQEIARLIREQQLGGLIFFQGGPVRQANLTNYYQSNHPSYYCFSSGFAIAFSFFYAL